MSDTPCQVPLVEALRSVPVTAREMIEIHPTEHRNIPYGRYCHDAADAIAAKDALIASLSSLLQQMLDVAENCDETGYADGVGFVDLDKLHEKVRAAIQATPESAASELAAKDALIAKMKEQLAFALAQLRFPNGPMLSPAGNVVEVLRAESKRLRLLAERIDGLIIEADTPARKETP